MGTGVLSERESSKDVMLTTDLQLAPRLRMCRTVSPPPVCLYVVDREDFTILLYFSSHTDVSVISNSVDKNGSKVT
jgi:hypothetical protein